MGTAHETIQETPAKHTPPPGVTGAAMSGGRGNAAAQEGLAAALAKEKARTEYEPIVAGTVIEAHPDGDALLNLASSLYGSAVGVDAHTAGLMTSKFAAFDDTELGPLLRAAVGNGRFSQQPYYDTGWQNAGIIANRSGEGATFGQVTPVCQVRCEVQALIGDSTQFAQSEGASASETGADSSASHSSDATSQLNASASGVGIGVGGTASNTRAASTSGSSSLSLALPVFGRSGVMAFKVTLTFKRVLGAPPPKREGMVRAGRVKVKTTDSAPA